MLHVNITKRLANFELNIAFEIEPEILVLFGPSGAGKSLTLSCIAGIVRPDSGLIQLDEVIFFKDRQRHLPPHKRGVGVVFQGYALFPHLTVRENVAYGLRYHRRHGLTVDEMLHRLRLETLADRYPPQLSGGQQQRVALGRALIIRPKLLLLDEPFAALDVGVREHLQTDILALQKEYNLTVIYVTHSLEDTFVLGDKLAVLRNGHLQQLGAISEVFHRPNSRSVAEITGVKNIFEGRVATSSLAGLQIQWGDYLIERPPADLKPGDPVIFYIRPEHVKIIHPDKPLADTVRHNLIEAEVTGLINRGTHISLIVSAPGMPEPVQLRFPGHSYQNLHLTTGSPVTISLLRDYVTLLSTGNSYSGRN